ncbi:hypothetical protein ACF8CX_08320 [Vibrio mimicus]
MKQTNTNKEHKDKTRHQANKNKENVQKHKNKINKKWNLKNKLII